MAHMTRRERFIEYAGVVAQYAGMTQRGCANEHECGTDSRALSQPPP